MIGPSSSHTAGAVRIGLLSQHLLGNAPRSATISLHGSFAATGQDHATEWGIAAGILGWPPDDDHLKDSLSDAAGIGHIIGANACFSGAQCGCQAEVGSTSSMAAAAIIEAVGGTPTQAVDAAAFALMNTLGFVCDPVGGYVEISCVCRNGMFAVNSHLAATMALAGARCVIPYDEVVLAMRDIGRRMPRALKETSMAGLATTPTGLSFTPKKSTIPQKS